MDLNDYTQTVNAVSNLNASVLNADNLAQQAKEKIPDTIGDILIGDASREILGKVLTPLAKGALSKLGLAENDVADLAKGKFKKLALRKLKQKLGMDDKNKKKGPEDQKEPEEPEEPEQPTPEQPTPEQPTPTPEQPTPETGLEQPTPEQPTPEQPTPEQPTPEEPEQPIENAIEDAPEDLGEPTMTSAFETAGRSFTELSPEESLLGGLEASGAQQAQQAAQAAQQASQAIEAPVEDAIASQPIEGLPDFPGLTDSLGPMREMMARTAQAAEEPAAEEPAAEEATQEGQSLSDALSDPEAFRNYANENFPEFADRGDDFFEEARSQLRDLSDLNVDNPIVNRPTSGQQLGSDENTAGQGENLVNEEGGNIQDLASNATGSGSGSGDSALSNVVKDTAEDAVEDVSEDAVAGGLDAAAASTAEIPGVGEILAPLLVLAGGLASLFGHKAEATGPTLNPSFQFV